MSAAILPGKFVWRELFTNDVEGSKRFYTSLFGWTVDPRPMGDAFVYHIWKNGDAEIGGMMDIADMPDGSGDVPPNWSSYVSVPDVDAAVQVAIDNGGNVLGDCHDIPNVGRFAVVADPFGAVISFFRRFAGDGPDTEPGLGDFCWENLTTPDAAESCAFYKKVVGWDSAAMFGDAGTTILTRDGGKHDVASVGPSDEGDSHWGTFVSVADVDATLNKAKDLGAQVLVGRTEIPVGAFGLLMDPQGAMIFVYKAKG